jgi:hypothetical protein
MSSQNDLGRPNSERKLALSGLIRRTMATATEREQQRSKLITVLILALFLVTAITTAGYIGSPTETTSTILGAAALLIYCCAYFTNRFLHRGSVAAYILVIGGGLAIAGQTLVVALSSEPVQAGQASLLFVAVILEAGLLFTPEITLLTAFATTAFSGFAILLGLSSDHSIPRSDAYSAVALTLGLQALTALIAWLFSQYVYETEIETQRSQELQFAQARLEALSSQAGDHQRLISDSVGDLLQTISRAMAGEYMVRAEIPESELTPLADSLNILFQRYETATQAEQMRFRMEAGALPIIDTIDRMSNASTPTPPSLPLMTNTPLDSVSMRLAQMQASLNNKLGRVQRMAGEVVSALNVSKEPLHEILDAVQEAQRIAGVLVSTSDAVLSATRQQLSQLFMVRRMLSLLLPEEITRMPENDQPRINTGELSGLAQDLGLGPSGFTGQFEIVPSENGTPGESEDSREVDIAPMTLPLAAIGSALSADSGDSPAKSAGSFPTMTGSSARAEEGGESPYAGSGEVIPELIETWNLISQVDLELGQIERVVTKLRSQIGVQSKQLRTADANIDWFRSALEAVRSNAEQLQQIAGTSIQVPGAESGVTSSSPSRPLRPAPPAREPQLSSLADDNRPAEYLDLGRTGAADPGGDDSVHAPGSLRATDLVSFEDIDFTGLSDLQARSDGNEQSDS